MLLINELTKSQFGERSSLNMQLWSKQAEKNIFNTQFTNCRESFQFRYNHICVQTSQIQGQFDSNTEKITINNNQYRQKQCGLNEIMCKTKYTSTVRIYSCKTTQVKTQNNPSTQIFKHSLQRDRLCVLLESNFATTCLQKLLLNSILIPFL